MLCSAASTAEYLSEPYRHESENKEKAKEKSHKMYKTLLGNKNMYCTNLYIILVSASSLVWENKYKSGLIEDVINVIGKW